jgi:hypothetical protein
MTINHQNIATVNPTVLFTSRDDYENFRRMLTEARRALHAASRYLIMGTPLEVQIRKELATLNEIEIEE